MATAKQKKTKPKARISKINAWFRAYTDESNPRTFLNKTESARAAGYKTTSVDSLKSIGHQNFTKLSVKIDAWLDQTGLSETALKQKLVSLLDGKKTVFQKVKGAVAAAALPAGWQVVATSGVVVQEGEDGTSLFTADETLLAADMENLELQRRTLDMALKVRSLYSPEKHEHSGKDGTPINHNLTMDEVAAQLLAEVAGATRGLPNRTQEKIWD